MRLCTVGVFSTTVKIVVVVALEAAIPCSTQPHTRTHESKCSVENRSPRKNLF